MTDFVMLLFLISPFTSFVFILGWAVAGIFLGRDTEGGDDA
jgi:hypothetical protein